MCNRSFNGDRPTQTHSRHTQSHADPSRARQARSGPSDPRSLPDPTDPPSEQASTTDPQPVLQPDSQPRTARAAREPAESPPHAFVQLARRAPSIPGLPRDPARGGAHRGRERRPHTQHTHPHTLLHSLTPSRRDGRGRRALTAACCPPRTPRLLPGRPTLRRPPRRRAAPVSPPGASG